MTAIRTGSNNESCIDNQPPGHVGKETHTDVTQTIIYIMHGFATPDPAIQHLRASAEYYACPG